MPDGSSGFTDPAGHPRGYADIKALAKSLGVSPSALIVEAPQNDPFFSGSKAHCRDAEWFAGLFQQFNFPRGVHLRRIHYRLVSLDGIAKPNGDPYQNTDDDWKFLAVAAKHARYLELVDAVEFDDRRNAEARRFSGYGWDDDKAPTFSIDLDSTWCMPWISVHGPHMDIPQPEVSGYTCGDTDQPYHLELWVEKSTLDDVLVPICQRYGVDYVVSSGFFSITRVLDTLRRVQDIEKPTRIFVLADFDPAGVHIPTSLARQFEYWQHRVGAEHIEIGVDRLALNPEHIQRHNLPRIPIKATDRRKDNFELRHGVGGTEIDALEAVVPGELQRIVKTAFQQYRDDDIADEIEATREEAEADVAAAWEAFAGDEIEAAQALAESIGKVETKYQKRLKRLRQQMAAELAPLADEQKKLWQAVKTKVAEFDFELPDKPTSDVTADDNPLFDNRRDYWDQLAVYKAHQNGGRS